MSVKNGFHTGLGCVFGMVLATVLVFVALHMAGTFITPCRSCLTSGQCILCGGNGKGIMWGDCMKCNGAKKCQECSGSGWRWISE